MNLRTLIKTIFNSLLTNACHQEQLTVNGILFNIYRGYPNFYVVGTEIDNDGNFYSPTFNSIEECYNWMNQQYVGEPPTNLPEGE
jgi:hypothetical protein